MDIKLYNKTYHKQEDLSFDSLLQKIVPNFLHYEVYNIDFELYNIDVHKDDDIIHINHVNEHELNTLQDLLSKYGYIEITEDLRHENNNI